MLCLHLTNSLLPHNPELSLRDQAIVSTVKYGLIPDAALCALVFRIGLFDLIYIDQPAILLPELHTGLQGELQLNYHI